MVLNIFLFQIMLYPYFNQFFNKYVQQLKVNRLIPIGLNHRCIYNFSLYIVLVLFLLGSENVFSQVHNAGTLISRPAPDTHEVCTINPTEHNSFFSLTPDGELQSMVKKSAGTLFEVDFHVENNNSCGNQVWPEEASNAFRYALDIWAAHIQSDVSIKVSATWREYADGDDRVTLGGAAPTRVVQLSGIGKPDTWYPVALLSALSGESVRDRIDEIDHDITVNMNCGFPNWYFGTDGKTPRNQVDFVTVVLHEIGHGIGFIGSVEEVSDASETARWGAGNPPSPYVYDRFVVDGDEQQLINQSQYPNPSADLFEALTGKMGGLFLDGEEVNHTLTSQQVNRAVLYAPEEYRRGSSYSHLDQQTFTNTQNALMRPSMDRASAIHTPGPIFCGLLRDMEWPLGDACLAYLSPFASIQRPESEFQFGVTSVNEPIQQTILIENSPVADVPLQITAEINGNFFELLDSGPISIAPGSQAAFQILYSPTVEGIHTATLTLHHDGKNLPSPITIQLTGETLRPNQLVRLGQSYPNPVVSASTGVTINYALIEDSMVRLDLYTVDGRHVQTIINTFQESGQHEVMIDLNGLTSGIYIYRIAAGSDVRAKKLMLFR